MPATRGAECARIFFVSLLALTSSVVAFAFVGCNSILDNQPGIVVADKSGALPDPGATPALTAQNGSDSGDTTSRDAGDEPSSGCPTGQQMCFGSCVSLTDPLYGCGDPTCSPCPSAHSTMGCQGRKCVVTGCDPGYSDCNATSADGCETDLSKATSCGACNAVCEVAAPLCVPTGSGFQCTNGCTPAAPLRCAAECIDPSTSTNHCGGCNVTCPVVTNGTEACVASVCGFTCKPLFHACAGRCAADTDATACGAACTVCPARANASATCAAKACGFTCTAGFGNCDANAANGCEANFASDPAHCGSCSKKCAALKTCVAGVCK